MLTSAQQQSAIAANQLEAKYAELLSTIHVMGKEVKPSYAGSKSSVEKLKRGKKANVESDEQVDIN